MEGTKRIQRVDLIKGVGICLMVIGHASGILSTLKLIIMQNRISQRIRQKGSGRESGKK